MRSQYVFTAVLIALWSSSRPVQAMVVDEWVPFTQPDGTTFGAHVFGDEFEINWFTADGYAFVYNPADGYLYYAELNSKGDYQASVAKVGIDDPATHGIEKNLQRSTARRAAIQAERIAHGYVRSPEEEGATKRTTIQDESSALYGAPDHAACTGASPCDVYVVMVRFADQASGGSIYADYDQPWGYPMALFNQFFNGGYEEVLAYTGSIAHTSMTRGVTENLTVFGSLRAYFHQVHGEDVVRFHILNECEDNPCGETSLPTWIPLNDTTHPNTKEWYATHSPADFWNAAEAAACANLTLPTDFPAASPCGATPAASANTLLTNKVLYLYAGSLITDSSSSGGLHPRVNVVTRSTTNVRRIGARYVMSERQGFTSLTARRADRFAGIGMHVHEFGHLFGFVHPDGGWEGENPHTMQSSITPPSGVTVEFGQANLSGWGSMQTGAHGPEIHADGYSIPHRSCPQPYNPFYRMDIGWNNAHTITSTTPNYVINPGPSDFYVVRGANDQDYILDFRTAGTFGQYTGWYRFADSPGLLIWRRSPSDPTRPHRNASNPMVVPADGRSIYDARPRPVTSNPAVPSWRDRLSDPFGGTVQPYGPTVLEATDASHLRHETVQRGRNTNSANPDPGPSYLAFRNIKITSDSDGAYASVDIHFIPLPPTNLRVTATPVEGDDNAVTLSWTDPAENGDPISGYQYRTDGGITWLPSLDADPLTLLTSGATITGLADTDLTFQVRTVSAGIAPHNVSAASDAVVLDRPGRIEVEAVEPTHTPPTVDDQLTATLTDANVPDDSWTGITVTWQWQRKLPDDEDWTNTRRVPFGTNTDSYTLADDDMGHQVRAMVTHYVDPIGSTIDTATSDPVTVNSRPEITSTTEEATNPSVEEESSVAIYTYTAADPDDGNEIEWSLGETNESLFSIGDTTGALTFEAGVAPNFEELGSDHPYEVEVIASDGSLLVPLSVTVRVTNLEEIGTVTVSPLPPEVDQELTATLADGDNLVSVDRWTWERAASATAASDWTVIAETFDGEPTNHYTPTLEDVGWVLQATAYYEDGHGPNKSRESDVTAAVVGPELDGPESLTFVEHGTFVADGEEVVPTYTVSGVDGTVTWLLSGADAAAFDLAADSNQASLSFSETELPNFEAPTDTDEGGTNTYHVTVVATPTDGAPSSSEQDSQDSQDLFANLFAAFKSLSNEDVSAHASSSLTQAVVVTVEDGDDPGVVSLPAGPPRVGTLLTAWLVDEDEDLTDMVWTWLADGDVVHTASGDTTAGYEPQPADESRALQAQVGYKDPFGAKTVVSALTAAVQPAGAVTLTPSEPRVGQPVTALLSGPDEPVTGAAWSWWRQRQGSDNWDLIGSSEPAASEGAASTFATMLGSFNWGWAEVSSYEPTVADTGWVLRARVGWAGQEVSSPASAPVRAGVPDRPRSLAGKGADGDDGYGAVVLTWKTPFDNGSPITGYEYQYRLFGTTEWKKSWTALDGSTQATTSHTVDSLALGEMHTFEVRAISDTDAGRLEGKSARTQAEAKKKNTAPVIRCNPPFPVPILENTQGPLENTDGPVSTCWAEDAEGDKVSWEWTGPDAGRFWFPNRKVRLKQPQDFEEPTDADGDNAYQLRLIADDGALADTLDATVWMLNVDEPPELYGQSEQAILENRTGFVGSYYAYDPEGESITWSLSGPDHALFALTLHGQKRQALALLSLEEALNFERPRDANQDSTYELYVEASDTGHLTQIAVYVRVDHKVGKDVSVAVLNENEPPWVHGPLRLSFAENDTGFVASYHAYDPDAGDGLRWSLGEQTAPFRLDAPRGATLGRLYVARPMDYEAIAEDAQGERAYQLDITVRDEGLLSSSVRTKVVVLDVNEPPVLSGPSVVNMNENLTYVASFTATDPEETAIRWSLLGLEAPLFRLSSAGSSGTLYFLQAPDYESDPTSYSVTIQATDATGLFTEQGLSITILNVVDETPPSQPPTNTEGEDAGTVTFDPLQPREGEAVTATLEDGDGSITNTAWTWEVEGSTVSTGSGAETDSYTPQSTDVGKQLVVTVSYQDAEGTDPDQASATSAQVLGATEQASCLVLALSGPETVSYPKQGTGSVASYSVTASHCDALSWSLSGADADAFSLSGSGTSATLYFTTTPTAASYAVTITVTDDSGPSLTKSTTITIQDDDNGGGGGDQPGSISLSSNPPKVGEILTATLTDPDGDLKDVIWGFDDVSPAEQSQTAQARAASSPPPSSHSTSFLVQLDWLGHPIRVLVFYSDGHGPNKSAETQSAAVQANVPGAPGNPSATAASATSMQLSWTAAAANGSAITDYQYQYRKSATSSWSGWTGVGAATSTTVSNLESGASYDFEVRAVNGVGAGPVASTSSPAQAQASAKPVRPATLPVRLAAQAAPNPFNPTTTLHLALPGGGRVALTLYNMAGQRVRSLVDETLEAGYHAVVWDGRDAVGGPVSSGVYLYRVMAGEKVIVGKMALIR